VTRHRALAYALLLLVPLLHPVDGRPQTAFRSSALAVRVDVLVTDGRKPVGGLTAHDFDLRDNGIPQTIEIVDAADVPLNVVLALDTSASTRGSRQAQLVEASGALLDRLKPADRAALTTFSHAVAPRVPLTADVDAIRAELARVTPGGRTAVMDAAYVALTTTLTEPGRSLVVIATDGSDISSWLGVDEVIETAKRANAVVYAVGSADARRTADLERLAQATGGDLLRVTAGDGLRAAFETIVRDFRSRYILAYTPAGVQAGGFHKLDVRVKRRGLKVTARPGYVGVDPRR
jgi:VWFA-related protein